MKQREASISQVTGKSNGNKSDGAGSRVHPLDLIETRFCFHFPCVFSREIKLYCFGSQSISLYIYTGWRTSYTVTSVTHFYEAISVKYRDSLSCHKDLSLVLLWKYFLAVCKKLLAAKQDLQTSTFKKMVANPRSFRSCSVYWMLPDFNVGCQWCLFKTSLPDVLLKLIPESLFTSSRLEPLLSRDTDTWRYFLAAARNRSHSLDFPRRS